MHSDQKFAFLRSAIALAAVAFAIVGFTQTGQAQSFTVIHSFNGPEGAFPEAGLTIDAAGAIYGTTSEGGGVNGNVFKLTYSTRNGWTLASLYLFTGAPDGYEPWGRVSFGPDGSMYGPTYLGGNGLCHNNWMIGCGTVYQLTRSQSSATRWNEGIVYSFAGRSDGEYPQQSDVFVDQSGNVYGTTTAGGFWGIPTCRNGCGTVYKLSPSGGGWTETVVYSFHSGEGQFPSGGVVPDEYGNLYGVTLQGGQYGLGAVYELSPSGSGWTIQTLYSFTGGADGLFPMGSLIFDSSGNLFGTASTGGSGNNGTVFELTHTSSSWAFQTLYDIQGSNVVASGPRGDLAIDTAGNLYGTTNGGGAHARGSVFKLSPSSHGWTYTTLYDFNAQSDGGWPTSGVVLDSAGNLYGMTTYGGTVNCYCGVIYEITP